MPSTAPDTRSLPYRRPERQSEKSQSRARCALRMRVLTDKRLSMGARVLYCLLDDYAGLKAECWPSQGPTKRNPEGGLSKRIGKSVRSVKRWIAELVAAGYVAIRRTQSGNRYSLAWSVPENNAQEQFGPSEVPTAARVYIEPEKELNACDSNIIGRLEGSEWEFGLDDAVQLFEWAARTGGE